MSRGKAPRHMRPGNRQQRRAMHTGSKAWRALRAIVLEDELYKCRWCGKFGDHVDHIDGKAENPEDYRRENLQCLCFRCHSIKTAQENGGFGNDTVDRPSFDAQGNPIGRSHWNS